MFLTDSYRRYISMSYKKYNFLFDIRTYEAVTVVYCGMLLLVQSRSIFSKSLYISEMSFCLLFDAVFGP